MFSECIVCVRWSNGTLKTGTGQKEIGKEKRVVLAREKVYIKKKNHRWLLSLLPFLLLMLLLSLVLFFFKFFGMPFIKNRRMNNGDELIRTSTQRLWSLSFISFFIIHIFFLSHMDTCTHLKVQCGSVHFFKYSFYYL